MTATRQLALVFTAPEPRSVPQLQAEKARTIEALRDSHRGEVIALAHAVAVELCTTPAYSGPSLLVPEGCTCAPFVLDTMRERGLLSAEDIDDTRWMGAVFVGRLRPWARVSYAPLGSKGRVVAVWKFLGATPNR